MIEVDLEGLSDRENALAKQWSNAGISDEAIAESLTQIRGLQMSLVCERLLAVEDGLAWITADTFNEPEGEERIEAEYDKYSGRFVDLDFSDLIDGNDFRDAMANYFYGYAGVEMEQRLNELQEDKMTYDLQQKMADKLELCRISITRHAPEEKDLLRSIENASACLEAVPHSLPVTETAVWEDEEKEGKEMMWWIRLLQVLKTVRSAAQEQVEGTAFLSHIERAISIADEKGK